MVLKPIPHHESMEQEFELNSLDENLKSRMEVHLAVDGIGCCVPQRGGIELQSPHPTAMQYPGVEMHCPAVASLPGGGRRLTGAAPAFAPEYHGFPPSPTSLAAQGDSPAMQPDGRTNLLEETMLWLPAQPLDLRNSDDLDSWMLRRVVYGDMLAPHGIDDTQPHQQQQQQHILQQQQQHMQQPKMNSCMNGYGGSVESVPGSSSSGSFSASDDCDSLTDLPSPSYNPGDGSSPGGRAVFKIDPTADPEGVLNDEQLIALSVRDLNRKLHGFPREVITRIKQKRRTLKNRGYAQNCRTKRIALKCLLEKNNHALQMEKDKLLRERDMERHQKEKAVLDRDKAMRDLDVAIQERDYYKQQLKQQLAMARSRDYQQQQQASMPTTNNSNPSSPEFYI